MQVDVTYTLNKINIVSLFFIHQLNINKYRGFIHPETYRKTCWK